MRLLRYVGCVCVLATLGAGAGAGATGAQARAADLEIRLSQSGYIIAQEVRKPGDGYNGAAGYYDLILHNLAVINAGSSPVTIDRISLDLSRHGRLLERSVVSPSEVQVALATYAEYAKLHFPVALNALFAASTILPPGVAVSGSATSLAPHTAIIATQNFMLSRGLPDRMTVVALGHSASGPVTAQASLPVVSRLTANRYLFPVEPGAWYVTGLPSVQGHHRFTQATEFALDITRVDAKGRWFKHKGRHWTDWYAYGANVLAAADGVVVAVESHSDIDPEVWRPRDGETEQAYQKRLDAHQLKRFLKPGADPSEVSGGNYVIIKHANGEYSHYAHLAFGSVRVKVGEHVKQGQVIARIGGTGEAPEVHLHFEVTDSTDTQHYAFHSLPVDFINVSRPKNARQTDEPAVFVTAH